MKELQLTLNTEAATFASAAINDVRVHLDLFEDSTMSVKASMGGVSMRDLVKRLPN